MGEFTVKAVEAMLERIPPAYKQFVLQLNYDGKVASSSAKPGPNPKWNTTFTFENIDCKFLVVSLVSAGSTGMTEVGRCEVLLEDARASKTCWWHLLTTKGSSASVLLTFEFLDESFGITSLSNISTDLKQSLELNPSSLISQNLYIKEQDMNIKRLFENAKREHERLKKLKSDLKRCKASLHRRERSLVAEELQLTLTEQQLDEEEAELDIAETQLMQNKSRLQAEKKKLEVNHHELSIK
mmetsp:Transcript_7531/g.14000  ORF Transcript_7531/g.14000 Transcript_7531/m.14000 type:complete len:241 (-) Transcript_7531:9380-10102(-)